MQEDSISLSHAQTRSYVFRLPLSLLLLFLLSFPLGALPLCLSPTSIPLSLSLSFHCLTRSQSAAPLSLSFSLPRPPFIPSLPLVFAQLTRVSICFIKLRRIPSPPRHRRVTLAFATRCIHHPLRVVNQQPCEFLLHLPERNRSWCFSFKTEERARVGNKKESLHYVHPTLQPFLTNLMPPAVPVVSPPRGEKQARYISERPHLAAGFMEKHTSLGGERSLRVKEAAATGEGRGWPEGGTKQ